MWQAVAILEHGETATESRTRGMGTMVRQPCGWHRFSAFQVWTALSSPAFGKQHKAPQEFLEGTAKEAEAWPLRFGGRFGGCLVAMVVPLRWWIWCWQQWRKPWPCLPGRWGWVHQECCWLILEDFSREKDETAEIEATAEYMVIYIRIYIIYIYIYISIYI
jgi:hypothetical protein